MANDISIWRALFYLSMLTLTIWLILKVAGVINTPVWLEYGLPVGSLIAGVLTFSQELFKMIRLIGSDITILKVDVATLKTRTDHIEKKIDHGETRMTVIEKKIDGLE